MQIALTALSSLLPQLPVICVMGVGVVIAIARWQKHPRVSALLVVVLSLEIASAILYPLLTALLIGSGSTTTQYRYGVWGHRPGCRCVARRAAGPNVVGRFRLAQHNQHNQHNL